MPTSKPDNDIEFDDLLARLASDKNWVDEKYAAPVDQEVLIRFYSTLR